MATASAELMQLQVIGCGICDQVFRVDQHDGQLIALQPCGHIFHFSCVEKFEGEGGIVLRVCFICKTDYAWKDPLKLNPTYKPIQIGKELEQQQKKKIDQDQDKEMDMDTKKESKGILKLADQPKAKVEAKPLPSSSASVGKKITAVRTTGKKK